jgi:hypothetical protein
MPSSLKLYTSEVMESIATITAGSTASGTAAWNLVNDDLDTYWAPTGVTLEIVTFDFGVAKSVSAFSMFIRNYASITGNVSIQWSDNNTDWSTAEYASIAGTAGPIRVYNFTEVSHRYWRFGVVLTTVAVEISYVAFGTYYAITKGNELPENEASTFPNNLIDGQDGRQYVNVGARYSYQIIPRTYYFFDSTNYNALRNAWLDSQGNRFWLVLQEGSAYSDALLVRFIDNSFPQGKQNMDIYKKSVTFREIPYIRKGEVL